MRLHMLTAFLFVAPLVASAQFPADVRAGTRVRLWIPDARQEQGPDRRQLVRGIVESVNGNTLRLTVPGTSGSLSIPRTSVKRLDVSKGVSRAASMFERAFGLAAGGALYMGIANNPRNETGPHFRTDWEAAGVGAAFGGALGAIVGLVLPYERWHRVIH
jgi:hypothetical protein